MKIEFKHILKSDVPKGVISAELLTPAEFSRQKGIARKLSYRMIRDDLLDHTEIDGVKFVVMNEKAKEYQKSK